MAVGISLLIGLIVGSISGYFGGFVDNLFMRIADIFLPSPGILLAIGITAVLGPSLTNVILCTLSVISWVGYARLIRGQMPPRVSMNMKISRRGQSVPVISG